MHEADEEDVDEHCGCHQLLQEVDGDIHFHRIGGEDSALGTLYGVLKVVEEEDPDNKDSNSCGEELHEEEHAELGAGDASHDEQAEKNGRVEGSRTTEGRSHHDTEGEGAAPGECRFQSGGAVFVDSSVLQSELGAEGVTAGKEDDRSD